MCEESLNIGGSWAGSGGGGGGARGGGAGAFPPAGPNSFIFTHIFTEKWLGWALAHPQWDWRPKQEILDPLLLNI